MPRTIKAQAIVYTMIDPEKEDYKQVRRLKLTMVNYSRSAVPSLVCTRVLNCTARSCSSKPN